MDTTYFRLILEGFKKDILTDKFLSYLKNELGCSDMKIKNLVFSHPRVLALVEKKEEALDICRHVEECGGRISMETAFNDDRIPFPLSNRCFRRIRHEIKKSAKGYHHMALISVRIIPNNEEKPLASLMDGYDEIIEDRLNSCAAVLVVDERRFLILDFLTDIKHGYLDLARVDEVCSSLFGETATVYRGVSLFPDNGTTVSDLVAAAEKKSERMIPTVKEHAIQSDMEGRLNLKSIIKDGESATELYQQMLIGARGKKYKWLSGQSLDDLWLGLGGLPKVRQQEFLFRLPVDSALIPGLEEAIKNRRKQDTGINAQRKIEEILIKLSGFDNDEHVIQLKKEIRVKLKQVDSLPTLSKVALTIVSIAKRPDSTLEELSAVIKNDPSLTLSLLKIVNSAYYGFRQKTETIERAVVILGREGLVNLAIGLGAAKAIDTLPDKGFYHPKALWHHLIGTAILCRYLYKKYNKKDDPGLFTAGLLHDFGKIFLVEHYSDIYGKIHLEASEMDIPLYELEEEYFGINHAIIGKHIGANWNLPESLIQAAAFHHQPFFATDHTLLAAVIGFADFLYHKTVVADDLNPVSPSYSTSLTYGHWHIIKDVFPGITPDDVPALIQGAETFINENSDIFSVLS